MPSSDDGDGEGGFKRKELPSWESVPEALSTATAAAAIAEASNSNSSNDGNQDFLQNKRRRTVPHGGAVLANSQIESDRNEDEHIHRGRHLFRLHEETASDESSPFPPHQSIATIPTSATCSAMTYSTEATIVDFIVPVDSINIARARAVAPTAAASAASDGKDEATMRYVYEQMKYKARMAARAQQAAVHYTTASVIAAHERRDWVTSSESELKLARQAVSAARDAEANNKKCLARAERRLASARHNRKTTSWDLEEAARKYRLVMSAKERAERVETDAVATAKRTRECLAAAMSSAPTLYPHFPEEMKKRMQIAGVTKCPDGDMDGLSPEEAERVRRARKHAAETMGAATVAALEEAKSAALAFDVGYESAVLADASVLTTLEGKVMEATTTAESFRIKADNNRKHMDHCTQSNVVAKTLAREGATKVAAVQIEHRRSEKRYWKAVHDEGTALQFAENSRAELTRAEVETSALDLRVEEARAFAEEEAAAAENAREEWEAAKSAREGFERHNPSARQHGST